MAPMKGIDVSKLKTYNYIVCCQERLIRTKNNTVNFVFTFLFRVLFFVTLLIFIFGLSLFLVFVIQYQMLPVMLHTFPVHLQHRDCVKEGEQCGYPRATLPFLQGKTAKEGPLLMAGQKYFIWVELDLPESEVPEKNNQAGTFMVKIDLRTWDEEAAAAGGSNVGKQLRTHNKVIFTSSRAGMLHYRSPIHRSLRLMALFPLYLTGYLDERQKLRIDLIPSYQEDPFSPVTDVVVQIEKAAIDVYRMTLFVEAHLEGIRYYMQRYPMVIGSCLAVLNFICGVILAGFSAYNRFARSETKRLNAVLPTAPGEDEEDDGVGEVLPAPGDFDPLEAVDVESDEDGFDRLKSPDSSQLRERKRH